MSEVFSERCRSTSATSLIEPPLLTSRQAKVLRKACARVRDTGTAEGVADHPTDGMNADRCIVRRHGTHEQGSVAGKRSLMLQINLQRLACGGGQR